MRIYLVIRRKVANPETTVELDLVRSDYPQDVFGHNAALAVGGAEGEEEGVAGFGLVPVEDLDEGQRYGSFVLHLNYNSARPSPQKQNIV
jgi:hypothetical protein